MGIACKLCYLSSYPRHNSWLHVSSANNALKIKKLDSKSLKMGKLCMSETLLNLLVLHGTR
jgi:hypothetical protein